MFLRFARVKTCSAGVFKATGDYDEAKDDENDQYRADQKGK
jgi:hypothetical protein